MNSYKCAYCGLVNWTDQTACKRCQAPNPAFAGAAAAAADSPVRRASTPPPTAQFAASSAMPDYASPPPPNVFGFQAGTGIGNANNNFAPPTTHVFGQTSFSAADEESLKKAEKEIRNAWISGTIVCAFTVVIAFIFSATAGGAPDAIPASPFEMLFSAFILGGLTVGVYFKSRACAVLLCGLFVLDKIITWAATGKMSGALLSFVFIYYFAYGIQGTFAYQKMMKNQRGNLRR